MRIDHLRQKFPPQHLSRRPRQLAFTRAGLAAHQQWPARRQRRANRLGAPGVEDMDAFAPSADGGE